VGDYCFEDTNRFEVLGQAILQKLTGKDVFVKQVENVLFVYCICTVYVLYMYCICTVYVLYIYCICTVYVLYMHKNRACGAYGVG
jgi:type IV secretory pathway VirB6-like protein